MRRRTAPSEARIGRLCTSPAAARSTAFARQRRGALCGRRRSESAVRAQSDRTTSSVVRSLRARTYRSPTPATLPGVRLDWTLRTDLPRAQRMLRCRFCILIFLALPIVSPAAEMIPPASQRFANAAGEETPSFQRHVVPLLGRVGCNGRACHGSFQGQGGFRLSLFGYDFNADHQELLKRIQLDQPDESLILLKPTNTVKHEGGRRFDVDSWQDHLLRRWLKAGAPGHSEKDAAFASLEVEPREIVFTKSGEKVQLRVTARWADGSREDVTPLARFRS